MFYPFDRSPIQPYFLYDKDSGLGEQDFLESALLRDSERATENSDFWRIAASGLATTIQGYFEDRESYAQVAGAAVGTFLSPNILARNLGEFVRHARAFAERFPSSTMVRFRCQWWSLKGREARDASAHWHLGGFRCDTDERISSGVWPVGTLSSNLPEIVEELAAPIKRAFHLPAYALNAEWVRGDLPKWR